MNEQAKNEIDSNYVALIEIQKAEIQQTLANVRDRFGAKIAAELVEAREVVCKSISAYPGHHVMLALLVMQQLALTITKESRASLELQSTMEKISKL